METTRQDNQFQQESSLKEEQAGAKLTFPAGIQPKKPMLTEKIRMFQEISNQIPGRETNGSGIQDCR